MKKSIVKSLFLGVFGLFLMTSCEKSVKGKWIAADKATFSKNCLAEVKKSVEKDETLKALGVNETEEKALCDCGLQKVEANYSPAESEKSIPEMKKIGEQCTVELIMGKKGAWTPKFKDFMTKILVKEMGESLPADVSKKIIECIINKTEEETDPKEMDKVEAAAEKISANCAKEIMK